MRKIILSISLFATGLLFVACGANSDTMRASSTPETTPTGTTGARAVTGTTTVENGDGSKTVVINYSDGSRSEERTFKSGRLSKVRRETSANGTRAVRVTYRADGKEKELKDPSWIDKAMDATADALVEVADKAEDVGDAAKKGAREAADKAEDVGDAAKKGAREAADKAEDVGDAAKKGAKKAGRKIKKAVKPD
jgi:predicted glycosyl hydrolase (DUF1957 family)